METNTFPTGTHILAVDDDPAILRLVRRLLEDSGSVQVTTTEHPEEATELVRSLRLDAAVLDYEMPGLNGIELARRIRALPEGADLPIVMITGTPSHEVRHAAEVAGINTVLGKPFDGERLIVITRALLRRTRHAA